MTTNKNKEVQIRQLALGTLGDVDMRFARHELEERRAREVKERIINGEFTAEEFCAVLEEVMINANATREHIDYEIHLARTFYDL